MKKLKAKMLPILIVILGLSFAGFSSYFLQTHFVPSHTETVLGVSSASPTPNPSPVVSTTPKPVFIKSPTPTSTPTPTPIPAPSSEPKTYITNNYITVISTPAPTPVSSPTPVPTPSLAPTPAPIVASVNIEIKASGTSSSFILQIEEGINACEVLVKAKNEGKIASVTLDDSYLATFNTLLVSEINGLSNYWVFTVNGESPMGCSLVSLKSDDQIIWEFINGGE